MENNILNKQIILGTFGDLKNFIKMILHEETEDAQKEMKQGKEYIYGISNLAKFTGGSLSTANRRIASGAFDECIIRNGRLLIFEKEGVMEVLKEKGWDLRFIKEGGKK